ncbi:MAG TPA: hypothetical protein VKB22_12420, partial [Gemmatimonadales bacterium]|nr:hypothetical protein [Gemmatimonadales bacterium]
MIETTSPAGLSPELRRYTSVGARSRTAKPPIVLLAEGTPCPYSSAMAFLDSKRERAALLIFVLGVGLVWTLWPFITG